MKNPFPKIGDYPSDFRSSDARELGGHLRLRHSVQLIGMKHVGIGNFLSFFLGSYKSLATKYIGDEKNHLLISVDLNNLVERELFPFWILTFKRLVDKVETSLDPKIKKEISVLFLDSIQTRDVFLTIENLRESLNKIVQNGVLPTIFFIRFDRLKDTFNDELLSNLEGLVDATGQKLSYVFTSFRPLEEFAPNVFAKKFFPIFSHKIYIKPAGVADTKIVFDVFEKKYEVRPSREQLESLLKLCGGHIQYLQLSLIIASQKKGEAIAEDERVKLLSEEIWESLTEEEQNLIQKIASGQKIEESRNYLWETGLVGKKNGKVVFFSPLFENFVKQKNGQKQDEAVDFTKKENLLFTLLLENVGNICEREKIINTVWPEYEDVGVSDWAIDRLVARLRTKLKRQNSKYSVVTVKTRGYKLVEEMVG